jgi:hypothetical protein
MGDHQGRWVRVMRRFCWRQSFAIFTGRFLNQWETGLPIDTFALTEKATIVERPSTRRK